MFSDQHLSFSLSDVQPAEFGFWLWCSSLLGVVVSLTRIRFVSNKRQGCTSGFSRHFRVKSSLPDRRNKIVRSWPNPLVVSQPFFFFFVWHRVCFTYFASPIEQSAIIHLNYSLLVFSQTPSSTSVYLYRLEHVCIVESWRDDGKDSTEAREIQLVLRYLHNFLQQIWPVDLDRRVSTDVSNSKLDLQSYSTEIVSSLDGN